MDNLLAKKTGRVDYIDIFRAFGIILMIMGHISVGGYFSIYIHAFHMPMFFVISGYFYKDRSLFVLFKERAKTLIIPYFVFGLLHTLIYLLLNDNVDISRFLYILFWENTADNGIAIAGALWFLTALFFADVFFALIQKLFRFENVRFILVVLFSVVGMIIGQFCPFRLPYAIDVSLVAIGFMYVGKCLRYNLRNFVQLNLNVSVILLMLFSITTMLNGYVNLREGHYAIWPLFWTNAIGLTISFWNISRYLYVSISVKEIPLLGLILRWVQDIGKNSIIYLCLNQLVIFIINSLLRYYSVLYELSFCTWLRRFLTLILTLLLLRTFEYLIRNYRIKILFGRLM